MIEFGSREFQRAEEIYQSMGISRSQFYRDKADLEKLGFQFNFDRKKKVFSVDADPGIKVIGLSLSEILALIVAVDRLKETEDFTIAYRAITGLRKISVDQPGPVSDFVLASARSILESESYGLSFDMLEKLVDAVTEKRLIHISYGKPGKARLTGLNVAPRKLVFRGGILYLEGDPGKTGQRFFRAAYIRNIIFTPFVTFT